MQTGKQERSIGKIKPTFQKCFVPFDRVKFNNHALNVITRIHDVKSKRLTHNP